MKKKNSRGNFAGIFGSVSGVGSVISAHNICHTLCLVVVAVLSVFGIMASSNILMFLEDYNLLFWSMGIFFLAISLLLYFRFGRCISEKLILANTGLLVIGIPFPPLQSSIVAWLVGGSVVLASIGWFLKERLIKI